MLTPRSHVTALIAVMAAAVLSTTLARAGSTVEDLPASAETALSGVVVSPHIAPMNSRASGTISRRSGNLVEVKLTSSAPAIAGVPASIWFQRNETSATFSVNTARAGIGGCATITATDPDNSVTTVVYVYPPGSSVRDPFMLKMQAPVSGGRPEVDLGIHGMPLTGTITRSRVGDRDMPPTMQLTSNNSQVSVPASVTFARGASTATFTATVSGRPQCAVITATHEGYSSRRLVIFHDISG